jgi:hypothetical protein
MDIAIEGLWTVEFGSSTGMFGGGVVVFQGGKILGGDGGYYYTGEYELHGDTFGATLRIFPFIEGYVSVFRTVGQELTLDLTGVLTPDGRTTAQGHPRGMPHLKFGAKLTRRA